ncbi:PST family polysaccharide transporter [Paenibacillus phyllosphaerae]|uniref:PST family polysaccharide transporter n=1 Tax=Paenibacillus phyllosphaerae TaxID=274593 RepID=A0A7W5FKX1_9BACL|nr:lipopolysaccharide biosynthesis protein [Paenibacillus phyllosphaerae]MBB3108566.1 PST family polysaccharide transporter [Paenibacillus phyllosphaerae]
MSTVNNAKWSFLNGVGMQMIALVTNVVLARLLYPEIFGLLGMATVLLGLLLIFQGAGVSSYIIYDQECSKEEVVTSFWLNIIISTLIATLLIICSPLICNFYNDERLQPILIITAVGLFFGSFGITGRALFTRDGHFKKLTIIDFIAELIASSVAIGAALYHHETFAITSRLLIKPIIQSAALVFLTHKGSVGLPQFKNVRKILPYGTKILGSQVFIYSNNNLDYLLIGRFLGSRELGIYTMAYQWSMIARIYIGGAINRVAFPLISKQEGNLISIKKIYTNMITKVAMVTFPICFGLMAISNEFVNLLYGDKWSEAVPVLSILLFVGAITSVVTVGGSVFNGLGKPDIDMKINMASFIGAVIIFLLSWRYGIIGIAVGVLIKCIVFDSFKLLWVSKLLKMKVKELAQMFIKALLPSLIMLLCLLATKKVITVLPGSLLMIILIIEGIIIYSISSYYLNRDNYMWLINKLASKAPFKTKIKIREQGL